MSTQYTYSTKVCATCEFWTGERNRCGSFSDRLEVSSAMDKGNCECSSAHRYGAIQANQMGCDCYQQTKKL